MLLFVVFKGWLERKRYLARRRAILILQHHVRCFLFKRKISTETSQARQYAEPSEDTSNTEKFSNSLSQSTTSTESLPTFVPLYVDTCPAPRQSWFAPFVPTVYDSLIMEKRQAIAHDSMEPLNSIHRGRGIASVRRIEKVPVVFHCRRTPLTNAETRPLSMEIEKVNESWLYKTAVCP